MSRNADLLEIVGALDARGGGANLLDGRQQEPNQNGDDGNDDKKLDEREGTPLWHRSISR
jgi:hypothetical protein